MKSNWDKYRSLNMRIGFIFSLGLALLAFEWKTYEPVSLVALTGVIPVEDPWVLPPKLETPPPPKPKVIIAPKIEEVPDDEEIEELVEEVVMDPLEEVEIPDLVEEPIIEEPVEEPPFHIAPEVPAEPEGGVNAFLKYVGRELKYPRQAKRMGVEGRVFLEFIVDTKGNITEVKVLRGIGAGCDEEAVRVLENAPSWSPARQRGRKVKQKMTFPINFRLK